MKSGHSSSHSEVIEGAAHLLPQRLAIRKICSDVERLLIEFPNCITGLQPLVMSSVTSLFTQEKNHTCVTSVVEVQLRVSLFFLENFWLKCSQPFNLTPVVVSLGFSNFSNLKEHKKTHTADKVFTCGECGKSFNMQRKLVKHRVRHTGERPYSCSACGKFLPTADPRSPGHPCGEGTGVCAHSVLGC